MAVNGDKPHVLFFEIDFGIKTRLQVIASDAAHILDQHGSNFSAINIRDKLLPAGAFKVSSAESIVRIMLTIFKAVCSGIGFKIFFLPKNRKGGFCTAVLPGYALIQRCHFHVWHPPVPVQLSASFSPCSGQPSPDSLPAAVCAFLLRRFPLPLGQSAALENYR